MTANSVNNVKLLEYKPQAKPALKNNQNQVKEPKDEVSLGRKIAKGAIGAVLAAGLAPVGAVMDGLNESAVSAYKGAGLHQVKNPGFMTRLAQKTLPYVPAAAFMVGLATGAGPIGAFLGAVAAPGAIAGTVKGVLGGLDGAAEGLTLAGDVGRKTDEKIQDKVKGVFGKILGKAAKVASAVAVGAVATPGLFLLKGVNKGFEFAEKAIGIKKNPKNGSEKTDNFIKGVATTLGGINGALGSSSLIGLPGAVGSGAGAMATGVKGVEGAVEGFVNGGKLAFEIADAVTAKKE